MAYRGANRGNGTRSHPCASFIRFTEEEAKRIAKLLRKRKLTMQAFSHAAIMRALNEATLGKKADGEVEPDEDRGAPSPVGLGIRDRIRDSFEDEPRREDREPSYVSPQTPMLSTARTVDDEVLTLARTVVESPQSARREVLKAACRALSRGRSEEEAIRLAEDLDAAIQRIEGVPRTALERVRARMGR